MKLSGGSGGSHSAGGRRDGAAHRPAPAERKQERPARTQPERRQDRAPERPAENYAGGRDSRPPKSKWAVGAQRFAVILCVLLAILALSVGAYMIWEKPPEPERPGLSTPEPTPEETPVHTDKPVPTATPEPTPEPSPTETPVPSTGSYTFLLVGMDKVGYNTDTIMVGKIDTDKHTIDVVSLPRDTLVNIPYETKKINTLYAIGVNNKKGGVASLKAGIRDMLGFEVDFYAVIDLRAFVEIVDAIGGVYYDVPLDMSYHDPAQDLDIEIKKGYQWLSGEEALKVVRFRSGYASADIGRIGTQQDFLKSVASQIISLGNIPNLTKLVDIVTEYVDTDLEAANISYFARHLLLCKPENIRFHTMPGNYGAIIGGWSYVAVDINGWLEMVNTYLNPYTDPVTTANVNLLTYRNGGFYSTVGYVSGGEDSFLTYDEYLIRIGLKSPTPSPEPTTEPEPESDPDPVPTDDNGEDEAGEDG